MAGRRRAAAWVSPRQPPVRPGSGPARRAGARSRPAGGTRPDRISVRGLRATGIIGAAALNRCRSGRRILCSSRKIGDDHCRGRPPCTCVVDGQGGDRGPRVRGFPFSTPVGGVGDLHRRLDLDPGLLLGVAAQRPASTLDRGSGVAQRESARRCAWAAMMPAMRAMPSTSALGMAPPEAISGQRLRLHLSNPGAGPARQPGPSSPCRRRRPCPRLAGPRRNGSAPPVTEPTPPPGVASPRFAGRGRRRESGFRGEGLFVEARGQPSPGRLLADVRPLPARREEATQSVPGRGRPDLSFRGRPFLASQQARGVAAATFVVAHQAFRRSGRWSRRTRGHGGRDRPG